MASTITGQNQGLFFSSDYSISTIAIITSDGTVVDITTLVLELDLYEDIFSPAMTGSIRIGEALDLPSSMNFHGNEFVVLNIDKPSLGIPINRSFRIYKLSDRELGVTLQNYTLHFCSEELFLSTQNLISKSYKGMRIDQMVNDILVNQLKVKPNKIGTIEQTSGIFDIIVPRLQPLEAIQWLRPKGYDTNKHLWFFFENRDGFNFQSYESLITVPIYCTYYRNVKTEVAPDKNINSFNYVKVVQDFDVFKSMRMGSFSSSLITYDYLARERVDLNFNSAQIPTDQTLNGNLPANGLQNRLGKSFFTNNQNMVKYVLHMDSDPSQNPINYKKWLAQNALKLGQLHSTKVVIVVPGDVLLKVGRVIELVIPKMQSQTQTTLNDPIRSGNYLITSVHHKFIQSNFNTIIECINDTVGTSLIDASQGSPTVQEIIKS